MIAEGRTTSHLLEIVVHFEGDQKLHRNCGQMHRMGNRPLVKPFLAAVFDAALVLVEQSRDGCTEPLR